jgi:exodeoxyribonuclease X
MEPQNLIFLDTETTGKVNGRLIQLAYKTRREGNNARGSAADSEIFVEYYKAPVPIEIEAMAVHHITEKKIADKPAFEKSAAQRELGALLADSILVAHNAKFDIGILETEGVKTPMYICTMKIAQSMYDLPMYKMQYLRYLWGIENDDATAHDAEGDVMVLEKVFDHMVQDYAATHTISENETIEKFIEISKNPVLLKQISFGKYAGKTFAEIKDADPSYLQWMATLKDKDEDFAYTVNYYSK